MAGPVNFTVPVVDPPETTELGSIVSESSVAGTTVKLAVSETPLNVALISTGVCFFTGTVATVNWAEVCPAGTTTDVGTVTGAFAPSLTVAPLAPAGPFNVTVPIAPFPPVRVVGATVTEVN